MVSPFDKSSLRAIEKALRDSDLGVNPSNDGNVIRVVLPAAHRGAPQGLHQARQAQGRGRADLGAQHPPPGQGRARPHRQGRRGRRGRGQPRGEGAGAAHQEARRRRSTTCSGTRRPSCSPYECSPTSDGPSGDPPRRRPRGAARRTEQPSDSSWADIVGVPGTPESVTRPAAGDFWGAAPAVGGPSGAEVRGPSAPVPGAGQQPAAGRRRAAGPPDDSPTPPRGQDRPTPSRRELREAGAYGEFGGPGEFGPSYSPPASRGADVGAGEPARRAGGRAPASCRGVTGPAAPRAPRRPRPAGVDAGRADPPTATSRPARPPRSTRRAPGGPRAGPVPAPAARTWGNGGR